MFCPSCKAELADGMKFCTQCGIKLEAEKTPSTQGSTEPRQASQVQEPASPIKQQPLQPQPPTAASQPAAQPQIQQQRPQQQKKQKQSKSDAPKKTGPVPFIALGVSVIALILAIVGFVLPNTSQPATPVTTNTPKTAVAERAMTDCLLISTTDPDSELNNDAVIRTEDASALKNSPVASGPFYAYRKVYSIKNGGNDYKVVVELHEAYPIGGRIWSAAYNPDSKSWSQWRER